MRAHERTEHAAHEGGSDELLTTQEAAAFFKVHPSTVRRWTRTGVLPCTKIGSGPSGRGTVRYRLKDLRAVSAGAVTKGPA